MVHLTSSVGINSKNKPIDVALIQALLKTYFSTYKTQKRTKNFSLMNVNGIYSEVLVQAIKLFQEAELKTKKADGKIAPSGLTFKTLIKIQSITPKSIFSIICDKPVVNTGILEKVNAPRFKKFFMKYHGLTVSRGEDFNGFFNMLQRDQSIKDIRWAAYILATAYHETTFSFKPVREHGLGKGYKYSKEFIITDIDGVRGMPNKQYTNVYYGRGYVQLTWDYNYKSIGEALGLNDKLYIHPDLVLNKDIAYKITSHGMRNGTFTGKKLSDYINGGSSSYFNARRIINGTDAAKKVADYAHSIEILLRLSAKPSSALH